jgi:Ser/Thr protein kinase RdoA (MazF antagonist)
MSQQKTERLILTSVVACQVLISRLGRMTQITMQVNRKEVQEDVWDIKVLKNQLISQDQKHQDRKALNLFLRQVQPHTMKLQVPNELSRNSLRPIKNSPILHKVK